MHIHTATLPLPARLPCPALPRLRCPAPPCPQILSKKVSPKAFSTPVGAKKGENTGEIGIEGTAIEDAEEVGWCCVVVLGVMVCGVLKGGWERSLEGRGQQPWRRWRRCMVWWLLLPLQQRRLCSDDDGSLLPPGQLPVVAASLVAPRLAAPAVQGMPRREERKLRHYCCPVVRLPPSHQLPPPLL